MRIAATWLLAVSWLVAPASSRAETIDLLPGGSDYWSMRNVFAPLSSLFLGPGYWYGERKLDVTTTPEDAIVDLFYVRAGFQKRFEQADAPVTVVLPKRIDANPKDIVIVRAFAEGFRVVETKVKVNSRTDEIHLDMEPLPNLLEAVAYRYFAGRASVSFLTREALNLRLTDKEDGFSAALNETGQAEGVPDALGQMRGPLVASVGAHQLGEDLLVQVQYGDDTGGKPEIRSRQTRDPVRELYVYTLDIISPRANTDGINQARAALGRIRTSDVTGCASKFDATLREELGVTELSRSLSPQGSFVDPYLRAAMRRLGQVSPGGVVTLQDGLKYDTQVPLQLAAAQNDSANARGFLALLRRFVDLLEPRGLRDDVLRGLIAPEMSREDFGAALGNARAAEAACRG